MSRLSNLYKEEVAPKLQKQFVLNPMATPRIVKITVSMGLGAAKNNKSLLAEASQELALITGQNPKITRAKKSVAGFKIRTGFPIGLMVTLRKEKMYEFLDRLITIALPRVRDFRGFDSKSFDKHANLNIGIKEHIAFAEIEFDKVKQMKGLNIALTTSTSSQEQSEALLHGLGFPLRRKK